MSERPAKERPEHAPCAAPRHENADRFRGVIPGQRRKERLADGKIPERKSLKHAHADELKRRGHGGGHEKCQRQARRCAEDHLLLPHAVGERSPDRQHDSAHEERRRRSERRPELHILLRRPQLQQVERQKRKDHRTAPGDADAAERADPHCTLQTGMTLHFGRLLSAAPQHSLSGFSLLMT